MDCLYYFWQFEACFHIQCVPTNRINTNRQVTGLSVIAKSGTGGGSGTLCTLHPSATRFESRLSKTFTNWHYICHWVVAQMYFCRFGLLKQKKWRIFLIYNDFVSKRSFVDSDVLRCDVILPNDVLPNDAFANDALALKLRFALAEGLKGLT